MSAIIHLSANQPICLVLKWLYGWVKRTRFAHVNSYKIVPRHFVIVFIVGINLTLYNYWLCWDGHGVLLNSKRHIDQRGAEANMNKFTVQ